MALSIERLGQGSTGALFDGAFELRVIVEAERDPTIDADTEGLFRATLAGTDTFERDVLVASENGAVMGMAAVSIHHLATNADKAELEIDVHPDHRRRGIGAALVDAALDIAETNGRTSVVATSVNSEQTSAFWEALGAEQKLMDRQSRLWLADTDESLMREWVAKRALRARDYRLEHFTGMTPSHLLSAVAHLNTAMNDAPLDDLDWEPDIWSKDDVLQLDELIIGRGRDRWTTVAFGPDDEPAALTTVSIQLEKPRFAHQGNTSVDPAHRNRGIGRWLKADMWLRLRRDKPAVAALDTDNAESNDPMLAINVAMGFAPLFEWSVWQADVSVLRAHIRAG